MAAGGGLLRGIGTGGSQRKGEQHQKLNPEERIAYQAAQDRRALYLSLRQELSGREADLLWPGPDEVHQYERNDGEEGQKGGGIAEGHLEYN